MTFKDDLDSDLGHMLSDSEFGIAVTYKPAAGGNFTLNVIFDNEYVGVDVGEESPNVTDQKPVARARLSDFTTGPTVNDKMEIESADYTIIDIQKDGTGAVDLIMEKD